MKRLYEDTKKEVEKAKMDMKKLQDKKSETKVDVAAMKANAKLNAEMEKMNKRNKMLEEELARLKSMYDEMTEKCSRSLWQLRQDHGEVIRYFHLLESMRQWPYATVQKCISAWKNQCASVYSEIVFTPLYST